MAITFQLGTDSKGRRRAKHIAVRGWSGSPGAGGLAAIPIQVPTQEGLLSGVVTSWKDQWGWVSCPQVGDKDVFAHQEDLPPGVCVQPGMAITFQLGTDAKGRRRAKHIAVCGWNGNAGAGGTPAISRLPMAASAPWGALGGVVQGLAPGPNQVRAVTSAVPMMQGPARHNVMKRQQALPGPAEFMGQQVNGVVASWKDPWGWVSNPSFAGDVFAHMEDVVDGMQLAVGASVIFTVGIDNKGRVRAKQIQAGNGPVDGVGGAKKRKTEFENLDGRALEGEVISWKSPWGWIRVPDITGDIFAHKQDVITGEELAVGQMVSFVVGHDSKTHRWRAMCISPPLVDSGAPTSTLPNVQFPQAVVGIQ